MRTQSPEETTLLGESKAFSIVLEQSSSLALIDRPVLVTGERGTGKELIASRLHYLSDRWEQPFVKINCAALSEQLLESELFGHEAGAFTDARRQHQGVFERADGGSVLLDEIGNASHRVQEQILRVIEYGQFTRVGGSRCEQVDVRIIASTNADLPAMAREGVFRHDLLDRLAFDVITLPPLREREDDALLIAEHFAQQMASELGHRMFSGFSDRCMEQIIEHHWPGNVRELKNSIERTVYRHGDARSPIDSLCLDPFRTAWSGTEPPLTESESPLSAAWARVTREGFKEVVQRFEINTLLKALKRRQYNQVQTARDLRLSYDQLRGYVRKYQLVDPSNTETSEAC